MITDQYLAGLFDGEGCISASYRQGMHIGVYIGMSKNVEILLLQINVDYGGNIHRRKRNIVSVDWYSKDDIEFILTKIKPYLIIKREQAKLMLWWVRNVGSSKRYGADEAGKVFIEELRLMKKNPLLKAEDTIRRIKVCFGEKDSNIVSIR